MKLPPGAKLIPPWLEALEAAIARYGTTDLAKSATFGRHGIQVCELETAFGVMRFVVDDAFAGEGKP